MKTLTRTQLVAVAFFFACARLLHAQTAPPTNTFTGAVDANWFNTNNWSLKRLPGPTETVLVTSSVTLTSGVTVGGFNLSAGTFDATTNGLTIVEGGNWTGGTLKGLVTNSPSDFLFNLNNPGGTLDFSRTPLSLTTALWFGARARSGGTTPLS